MMPRRILPAALAVVLTLGACSSSSESGDPSSSQSAGDVASDAPGDASGAAFDDTMVHDISVEFDEADYDEMIAIYQESSEKEWIVADVTIDGVTYSDVGLRLKGNSSLRSLQGGGPGGQAPLVAATDGADVPTDGTRPVDPSRAGSGAEEVQGLIEESGVTAESPQDLPWLIRLDKYIDGQNHLGVNDFVVRSNNSESSLNEAVALDLLEAAGLPTQASMYSRFTMNDGETSLRLVIEHPDDVWMDEHLGADGALYKAESTGDYSYRGDDPDSYDEVFDQEAGKDNADLTPVIEFLEFIETSDDETFVAELPDWLDIDEFVTYLAAEDIVQNVDDIDGPGNNSYLYYDTDTEQFTVVPWDHNLAFEDAGFGRPAGGGGPGAGGAGGPGGDRPAGAPPGPPPGVDVPADASAPPDGGDLPAPPDAGQTTDDAAQQGERAAGPNQGNALRERFMEFDEFRALYEQRLTELSSELIDSGLAAEIVNERASLLETEATDIVPADVIAEEADAITASLATPDPDYEGLQGQGQGQGQGPGGGGGAEPPTAPPE